LGQVYKGEIGRHGRSAGSKKVAVYESEQVWEMAITLSAPLPGSNKTQDTAYVKVNIAMLSSLANDFRTGCNLSLIDLLLFLLERRRGSPGSCRMNPVESI